MWTEAPDASAISDALRRAGLSLRHDEVRLERREERWLVRLPERCAAWFPASPEGERAMAVESRVLRLIRSRCSFEVPAVLFSDPAGEFEIRSMIGAPVDISRLLLDLNTKPGLAAEIGTQLGRVLAEQHVRIDHEDVRGWLPSSVKWPWPVERVLPGIETVVPNRPDLRTAAARVFTRCAALALAPEDFALVHTDVGFHNLAFAENSRHVIGLFDYDSAAWADRHHDFRYLLFGRDRVDLLGSAIESYEKDSEYVLSRERIVLYNAACAFSYLALRAGSAPQEKPCGRTLAEDLGWCEWAAENVLSGRGTRLFG
jgi:hypothetical protein